MVPPVVLVYYNVALLCYASNGHLTGA
jgi:hypothetical protein